MNQKFIRKVEDIRKIKDSRIIIAIDEEININLIEKIEKKVAGFKIGLIPMFYDLVGVKNFCKIYSEEFLLIADLKIADVPFISQKLGIFIREMGFDAVIAHAVVGEDMLSVLNNEIPTIAVVLMTNEGSKILDENYSKLVDICNKLNLAGIVAPATKPALLREIRKMTRHLIFSPGIGAQGAPYGSAIKNGADYEIIGRSILKSKDPYLEINKALEMMKHDQNS